MKMLRIRRRFALFLCGSCMLIFLTLYFILNYAAPVETDKKPNYGAIETKLQQLENGLQQHGQEMKNLKLRIEKQTKSKQDEQKVKSERGNTNITTKIKSTNGECIDIVKQLPQTDVQMLDMYERMTFSDLDGGVWKQGWNIKYDSLRYNNKHKLKVFVVPHSHNDPGWIKTFDDYYMHDTKYILSNALRHLHEYPDMKFIWAEISYFSRFYEDLGSRNKEMMDKIIENRQLEFVTGGWVMPDEANSHWHNVLLQLTEGQTWLKQHLNITPTSSWAIDPFGHSATLPYILKLSGFENLLIQRTHYSVKKELAQRRQLEFHWRQLWDSKGSTDLFTHMMPFYSYDIPHTCGPDPKICCQFDFKRLGSFGVNCPWRVPPTAINDMNVAARADLIVDQWKKKAELYLSNVLLIPLGDDFRYKENSEWDVQRINYEKLFEYINAATHYAVEARFGTLQEYFDAVHREPVREFPTLSGDFFTYADRADNYWSGYYTSRPYHKRMDRVLMHYVHAAEMLHAWHTWPAEARFAEKLQEARRELSLFQHHDGITGTAKTHVVVDYAQRMLDAIKSCKFVMQQAVYRLLTKSTIYSAVYNFNYFILDDSRWPGPEDMRTTIILAEELPTKHIVLHNTLPHLREELVDFYVSSSYMSVTDLDGNPVVAQVSPVWSWHQDQMTNTIHPQGSTTKYRLIFKARVPPLGLMTYIIRSSSSEIKPAFTTFASNLILTTHPVSMPLGNYPEDVKFGEHRELSLRVGDGPTVAFSANGLLKSMQISTDLEHIPLHLQFLKYGTRSNREYSGAYLFLPNGPATPYVDMKPPVVLVNEGPLEASVSVGLPFIVHQTILRGDAPEIRNLVDIGKMDNTEIVMRFATHIDNGETFYTDLNGLQMIKRKRFTKLPLQANYYPVPTAIYIEDAHTRLTVLTAQPLGGGSLASGELEIMQDRRLAHDDERGLGQGVLDNQPVVHIFRVVLEKINNCQRPLEANPAGYLTIAAYMTSKAILDPLDKFIYAENDWLGVKPSFNAKRVSATIDLEVVAMRRLSAQNKAQRTGIVLHRTQLLQCNGEKQHLNVADRNAKFDVCNLLNTSGHSTVACHRTTLTFLQQLNKINSTNMPTLCPMDSAAFVITHNEHS